MWKLARKLWQKTKLKWHEPSIGTALGCALVPFPKKNTQKKSTETRVTTEGGKPKNGRERLYAIMMSETVYLIWLLRNECRIQNNDSPGFTHSNQGITNRWYERLNTSLKQDRAMANPAKFAKEALSGDLVLQAWGGTLHNKYLLPDNWIREPEVLVGRGPSGHRRM